MFISASAYNFLLGKPNLSQTQSLLSFVQVLRMHCAKTSVEQKQCYNIDIPPLKLFTHAKSSALYASGHMVM